MKKTILLTIFMVTVTITSLAQEDLKAEVFSLQHTSPEDIYKAVDPLKSPEGKVTLISSTHQIVVYDHPENLKRISQEIGRASGRERV